MLLCESPVSRSAANSIRGRPPVGLAVRPEAFIVAGIKLSSRDSTGILLDFAGQQLTSIRHRSSAPQTDVDAQLATITAMVDKMLCDVGRTRRDLGAVGVGVPGFVHHASGRVHWSWALDGRDIDFARIATERIGVPVAVDNDANLVALAELWFGKGRDRANFAVVTIEQGVGMGMVLDHRVFRGANGVGPELGHTKVQIDGALCRCGQRGCLEAYLADYAIAREAYAALNLQIEDTQPVPELIDALQTAAASGNEVAQSIFDRARHHLAAGLSTVINLFDPPLLILSGGQRRFDWLNTQDLLVEMQAFTIDSGQPLPPLVIHEWGDLLWAYGAGALALSRITETELGLVREDVA